MLVDNIACNGVMLIGGPSAMVFFPLLLWTILGHGFRFGRGYLVAAAATAVVCFGAVMRFGPGWESVPYLDVGLLFSLILLPAYFWILLGKLTDAVSRAEEASRAKSQFLATMSHEFRTPLNAVIGMSDLLRTTSLDAEQRGMVGTIRGAAGSLLALVNDLLDIASIEARRLTVEPVPFSLARELAGLRAMLHPQVRDKGLYLRMRWHPDTPSDLIGAAEPLHRILLNLTANAVRFTARGGVLIEVVPLELTAAGVLLRLAVRDTGIGIPTERQKEIFERFTQADADTRRRFGGTGLGLAIARDLATLMGGQIGVLEHAGSGLHLLGGAAFREGRAALRSISPSAGGQHHRRWRRRGASGPPRATGLSRLAGARRRRGGAPATVDDRPPRDPARSGRHRHRAGRAGGTLGLGRRSGTCRHPDAGG